MTNDDWKHVEEQLQRFFTPVILMCDGYRVILRLRQISQFKNAIIIFVNGQLEGEWLRDGGVGEEARRFFPTKQRYMHSRKTREIYKKMNKQTRDEVGVDVERRHTYKGVYWTSFSALKKHFIENNKDIELIPNMHSRSLSMDPRLI